MGQRGGALIIMVWAWLRKLRVREEDVPGVWGFAPAAFLLLSCYFGAFTLSSARHKTPPLVAMNI